MSSKEQDKQTELADLKRKIEELKALSKEYKEKEERLQRQVDSKKNELRQRKEQPEARQESKEPDQNELNKKQEEKEQWAREHLLKMIHGKDDDGFKDWKVKYERKSEMIINNVTIKYFKGLSDKKIENEYDRDNYNEAKFKINKKTNFLELKESACQFWGISNSEITGLRTWNHALLDLYDNKTVYETIKSQRLLPEFMLYEKNPEAPKISTTLNECVINENWKDSKSIKDKKRSSRYGNKRREKDFIELERTYRGLETYKPKKDFKLENDEHEKERIQGWFGSFLSLLVMILILFCTLSILIVRRDVSTDYWIQSGIHSQFLDDFKSNTNFFGITSPSAMSLFIKEIVSEAFFKSEYLETDNLLDLYKMIGPLVIRQVRTKETECVAVENFNTALNVTCYYIDYNEDTRFEETLGSADYQIFRTADENNISGKFNGEFSDYDGSGYTWKIFPSSTSKESFVSQYKEIEETQWIDRATRAVFIDGNLYAPNYDKFIPIIIALELTTTGYVYPSKLAATVIRTNVYQSYRGEDIFAAVCEALRLLVSFYCLFVYIYEGCRRKNYKNFYSFKRLLDPALFLCIVIAFGMSLVLTVDNGDIFNQEDEFYNLQELRFWYTTHLVMNAWVLIFLLFRFVWIFGISRKIHTFLLTLEYASINIMCLIVIMTPLMLGMLVITFNLWGPFLFIYRSAEWALLSNLLFTLGHGDIQSLLEVDDVLTIAIFLIYFFVIVFFIFSAFLGILIDAYRLVRMRNKNIEKCLNERNNQGEKKKCCSCSEDVKMWITEKLPCKRRRLQDREKVYLDDY